MSSLLFYSSTWYRDCMQSVCDILGAMTLLYIDYRVEATLTADIGFIKDDVTPFALYRAQPSTSSSAAYFKSSYVWLSMLLG